MNQAEFVIDKFGGLTPLAHAVGRKLNTISGWKNRGYIPAKYHSLILRVAEEKCISLDAESLINGTPKPRKRSTASIARGAST